MIKTADSIKRYRSAKERFFKPVIMNFLARECPKLFGPIMREKLTDELVNLFEAMAPQTTRLKPGQILWNALDKHTRGNSPRRRYVPVVLTIIAQKDIEQLARGVAMSKITQGAIARMIREAYQQGGILSSRDLALLTLRDSSTVSKLRKLYEAQNDCALPHTGALHDMGSCVSHKTTIVRKVVLEKKDPAHVARECSHSQRAVDRYLTDYQRVKTLHKVNHDIEFIHLTTQIAKHVIVQYLHLIHEEEEMT